MAMNGYPEDLSTKPLPWTRAEVAAAFDSVGDKVAAKASQQAVDNMAAQIAAINAEKVSKSGSTMSGPLYLASAGTDTGNAAANIDDVVRVATAIVNAAIDSITSIPTSNPPSVDTLPVISVVGGGLPVPGAVLQIDTAAAFSYTNTPTKTWQANQGTPGGTASGDTYTITTADINKALTIYYTATPLNTGYSTVYARSNAITAIASSAQTDNRISTAIDDMARANEAVAIDLPYSYATNPVVIMGAIPHGSAVPGWWGGTYYENWPYMLGWWLVAPAYGHAASNAAVELSGHELWVLKNSTKTWQKIDSFDAPGWHNLFPANSNINGGAAIDDAPYIITSASNIIMKPPTSYIEHGGSGYYSVPWVSGNTDDVAAVLFTIRCRLVKWNGGGADDLDSAVFSVQPGWDWYPSQAVLQPYNPGAAVGNAIKPTRNWRLAHVFALNPARVTNYDVINTYSPGAWVYSGEGGGGGGSPPPGTDTALDFGGGVGTNASRYYSLTMPALGSSWSIGFRMRSLKTLLATDTDYQTPLCTATNPDSGAGISFALDWYGFAYTSVYQTGGAKVTQYASMKQIVQNSGDWCVVIVCDNVNYKVYIYAEGDTVSTYTQQAAISGSGLPSQVLRLGALNTTPDEGFLNPFGDFFIASSAMTDANVNTWVGGADIDTILTPVVDLRFRDGEVATEANLGSGGTANDATKTGTGYTTTTAFT